MAKKKMDNTGSNDDKATYYEALEFYKAVSATAGPNSPAKRAEAVRKI
jgi:hypothetical protein